MHDAAWPVAAGGALASLVPYSIALWAMTRNTGCHGGCTAGNLGAVRCTARYLAAEGAIHAPSRAGDLCDRCRRDGAASGLLKRSLLIWKWNEVNVCLAYPRQKSSSSAVVSPAVQPRITLFAAKRDVLLLEQAN